MKDQAERLRIIARSLKEQIRSQIYEGPKSCRVFAVTSGKGGVGKTNLALGLSLALAKAGHRVMLLDADMGLADIDIILGLIPKYNLSHVFTGEKHLEEVLYQGPAGLQIIPGGSGIEELANFDTLTLTKLLKDIGNLDQKLDFLFVDTSAGISKQVMAFILAADEVLVVTTSEPTALIDAYGLIKVFKHRSGTGKLKLIINMVRNQQEGEMAAQKLLGVVQQFLNLEIEVAGYVPRDSSVSEAVRRHQPYILAFPRAPVSLSTIKIASSLSNLTQEKARGIKSFFEQLATFFQGQALNKGTAQGGKQESWQKKN